MKKNNKYNYIRGTRFMDHGSRTYEIQGMKLPSVTTILAKTKDQEYLTKWRNKIGHEEAERIFNLSSKRGTTMHKFLEKHIQGSRYEDLTEIGKEAKPMAQKIIDVGLAPIKEYYGSEITLHYPGLYAGSTDLVCRYRNEDAAYGWGEMDTIIDFKQANRPKQAEWIDDYYMQIAAYAMAHDYIHGSNIKLGIIMVCTPDLYYQEFKFSGVNLRSWKHKFLKRLDEYYKLTQEYKPKFGAAQVDAQTLLKHFEEDKQ